MKGNLAMHIKGRTPFIFSDVTPGLLAIAGKETKNSDNYANGESRVAFFGLCHATGKKEFTWQETRKGENQRCGNSLICKRGGHPATLVRGPGGGLYKGILTHSFTAGFAR